MMMLLPAGPWIVALSLGLAPLPALTPASGGSTPGVPAAQAQEARPLTLAEAIRVSLVHSEVVRVFPREEPGDLPAGRTPTTPQPPPAPTAGLLDFAPASPGPNAVGIVIGRLNADAALERFQSAILAHVRSVEQSYWALQAQQVTLWAREVAVRQAEGLLAQVQERRAGGRATDADVAEVEQRIENFRLSQVVATSDLTTTERQLRNLLGVSPGDDRRLVAVTAPSEAPVELDWEASTRQMLAYQPDISLQRQLLTASAVAEVFDPTPPGQPAAAARTPINRSALTHQRERQQMFLKQVVHQTTHGLARFYREVDANGKQFATARRLKDAATRNLADNQTGWTDNRITADKLLDAIAQFSNAVSQEAQYLASYNSSRTAFEEARGTLLVRDGITIVSEPAPHATSQPVTPTAPTPAPAPRAATPAPVAPTATPSTSTSRVRVTVAGVRLLEIEVEAQPAPAPRR